MKRISLPNVVIMKKILFSLFLFFSFFIFSQNKTGFIRQSGNSKVGYILFAPLHSKTTYLIDKCGKQVHSWKSAYAPGQSAYLLKNGDLFRCANDSNTTFKGGGRIEKFDWNNKLIWSYVISDTNQCQHHDICPLPNGNILLLVWEKISKQQAIAAGRNPEFLGSCLWSEKIIELKPVGKNKAKKVWEWRVWEHLVQDLDSTKVNFGNVEKNRQLININFLATNEPDWLHFNSIAYNAKLKQIMVSNRNFSELFIIEHGSDIVTTAQHEGGKYNKGGDLLYRYGNPMAYKTGILKDQILYGQHNAHWIEPGLKDEGKILLFNNGMGRREENYSSIEIISPPVDSTGNYGPTEKTSRIRYYSEYENEEIGGVFFSPNVSSAQRLSNGNILVCSGSTGQFCEIDENKKVVWLYINPVTRIGVAQRGSVATNNQVFRCTFFEPSFSGFKGRNLKAGSPIETGKSNYHCAPGAAPNTN